MTLCLSNTALEACSDSSWSQSDNTDMLIRRLKSNPYFPALQSSIAISRKRWLEANRSSLSNQTFVNELGLSVKASNCRSMYMTDCLPFWTVILSGSVSVFLWLSLSVSSVSFFSLAPRPSHSLFSFSLSSLSISLLLSCSRARSRALSRALSWLPLSLSLSLSQSREKSSSNLAQFPCQKWKLG